MESEGGMSFRLHGIGVFFCLRFDLNAMQPKSAEFPVGLAVQTAKQGGRAVIISA